MQTDRYFQFWGKTNEDGGHHPAAYHCLDVAACGNVLLTADPILRRIIGDASGLQASELIPFLTFLLSIHDLGKFSHRFQGLQNELFTTLQGRRSSGAYTLRHDSAGFLFFCDEKRAQLAQFPWFVVEDGGPEEQEDVLRPYLRAIMGHHGKPPAFGLETFSSHFEPEDERAATDFTECCRRIFIGDRRIVFSNYRVAERAASRCAWPLAGLAILADWLGSNSEFFDFHPATLPLADYWETVALPRARNAVAQSGVLPVGIRGGRSLTTLFPHITMPTPLQREVEQVELADGPGLYIIEDSTGAGKTEAGIALARKIIERGDASGLFFALPTMATSDAIFDRVTPLVPRLFEDTRNATVLLAHSQRTWNARFLEVRRAGENHDDPDALGDASAVQSARWLSDSNKKSLLAHFGVGTVDQALLGVVSSRHQSLRLLGMARGVLIVDEVHGYDEYMTGLLERVVEFQAALGGSSILMSATLPAVTRRRLIAAYRKGREVSTSVGHEVSLEFPLITVADGSDLQEIAVESPSHRRREVLIDWFPTADKAMEQVAARASAGQAVCWIRNTVADALDAFDCLKNRIAPENLQLLHARFALGDRLAREKEVVRRFGKDSRADGRTGQVLIATQVVEQSLDLDFDYIVTDLCPIDLLIQRAGRLRRHRRTAAGDPTVGSDERGDISMGIVAPEYTEEPSDDWYAALFPRGGFVYPNHGRLWLTVGVLRDRGTIILPEQSRELLESVYGSGVDDEVPAGLQRRVEQATSARMADASIADFHALAVGEGYRAGGTHWLDDTSVPSRLGERQTTVRLASWIDGALSAWFSDSVFPWQHSTVKARASLATALDLKSYEQPVAAAATAAAESEFHKGTLVVPLVRDASGRWTGFLLDARGITRKIAYTRERGLDFVRQEHDEAVQSD